MIPNINSLYRPVLECAAKGDVQFSDVLDQLADKFKLTDQELNEMLGEHSEQTRFATHVEWAQFLLEKLGLVTRTENGHIVITDLGKAALADESATMNKDSLVRWRESMRPEGPEGQIERVAEFLEEWEEHLQALFETPGFDVACHSLLQNTMREIGGPSFQNRAAELLGAGSQEPHIGETIVDEENKLVPVFYSGTPGFRDGNFVWDIYRIYDDDKGERLITMARDGDSAANIVLSYIAQAYIGCACVMPERLRHYIVDKLRTEVASRPKRRGPKPYTQEARNHLVALAVSTVARDLGISPTRNRASKDASKNESACSLVKKALEKRGLYLSESAVEGIWQDFRQRTAEPQRSSSS
jgi:hypothetical protein